MRRLLQTSLLCLLVFCWTGSTLWAESALPREERLQKAVAAGDYLCSVLRDNGRFLFEYNPVECKESEDYNWLSHSGAVLSLLRLQQVTGDKKYLAAAEKAAQAIEERIIPIKIGDQEFMVFLANPTGDGIRNGVVDTGECALSAMALAQLDQAGQAVAHKNAVQGLCRYLHHVQGGDGSLKSRYVVKDDAGQFANWHSPDYQGEALAALATAREIYPSAENLTCINRLVNFLAVEWALKDLEGGQEPFDYWGMIGFTRAFSFLDDGVLLQVHEDYLNALKTKIMDIQARLTQGPLFDERRALETHLARFDTKLNLMQKQGALSRDTLLPLVFTYCNTEWKGQILDPGRTEHGSFWNAQGNSADTALRLEGLEAVHDLFVRTPGTPYQGWVRRWEPRLDLVRSFVAQCQYTPKDQEKFACPISVAGGFRRHIHDGKGKSVRLDYCWHGVFALLGRDASGSASK
ncbi:MAG: hypothetical protein JEZ02_06270 [Desulfatibacillum sp.]|nr:hypothetical protein [Desulfatibacillum sp.]